eukprot:COSAG04_NODE_17490_length_468_cov_0.756098_1_plen_21_part_10
MFFLIPILKDVRCVFPPHYIA